MRRVLLAVVAVLLVAAALLAFEFDVAGTIRKIDADNGDLLIYVSGQDWSLKIDRAVKVLDMDGRPLTDGLNAKELKEGAKITITLDMRPEGFVVTAIRLGTAGMLEPKASVGLKPLTEMTAKDRYKGEDGGLYGGGKNEPPARTPEAARSETAQDRAARRRRQAGQRTARSGWCRSACPTRTQEFSRFKQLADRDPNEVAATSPSWIALRAARRWPNGSTRKGRPGSRPIDGSRPPRSAQAGAGRLGQARQRRPTGELAEHGKKLQKDTLAVLHNAKARFPNLRIAYLGSRIYGG